MRLKTAVPEERGNSLCNFRPISNYLLFNLLANCPTRPQLSEGDSFGRLTSAASSEEAVVNTFPLS